MFKNELIEHIREDYKELNNLEIEIDKSRLGGTLYNLLTPYLAHKNTLDAHNRLISFYTREGSRQQKLLPLYIGLSNYYKAFDDIKSEFDEGFLDDNTLSFKLNEIIEIVPSEFDYIGKKWNTEELSIDIEKNNRIHLYIESQERHSRRIAPKIQDILPHLKRFVDDFNELEKKVVELQQELNDFLKDNSDFLKFKQIRDSSDSKIGIQEILKLGKSIEVKPSSGVLLFTNKTKYRKLIEDTLFNGKSVSETFPIAEIKFNSSGELEVINSSNKSPVVFFCSSDYYAGWQEIKDSIGAEYLNTIIIDDFNTLLQRESKRDFEFFRDFATSIKEAQEQDVIKDVYFLDEDYNFQNNRILEKFGLHSYPWLLNYIERNSLVGNEKSKQCHQTISMKDDLGSMFWMNFKNITLHLSAKIKEHSSLEEKANLLSILGKGYDLLSRATSFYHPDLKYEIRDYIRELEEQNATYPSTSFENKIEELKLVESTMLFDNSKIQAVIKLLKESEEGRSIIVSKNNSQIDKKWANKLIESEVNFEVDFMNIDDVNTKSIHSYDNAFFLHYSGKITKTLFLTKYCANQFLILNDRSETGYYKKCFHLFVPEIIELSDFDNKLILLNLEEKEYLIDRNKIEYNLEDYLRENDSIEKAPQKETAEKESIVIENDIEEQNFTFVLDNLIRNQQEINKESNSTNNQSDSYLLLFENTFIKVPEYRYFYVLESDNQQDLKKKVSELKVGDLVFMMQGFNNDFNELLVFLKNEYSELELHFDKANSWRLDLQNKYESLGGYYTRLNAFLKQKGIQVSNPTVEKWVSGITILPDSLESLVNIFQMDDYSFSKNFSTKDIIDSTRWLSKFRTALHKEIFQYHVYKKYGMQAQINNLKLKQLIGKMDEIVSIQEIKYIEKQ